VPFAGRLSKRSQAAVRDAGGGWFVADAPDSRGTFATALMLAKARKPVRVFPLFPVEFLEPLNVQGVGYWDEADLFGVPFARWENGIPF
jgi:hypothetical protein